MTKGICDKSVNSCLFAFDSILYWYKSQDMCNKAVSEDLFFDSILP